MGVRVCVCARARVCVGGGCDTAAMPAGGEGDGMASRCVFLLRCVAGGGIAVRAEDGVVFHQMINEPLACIDQQAGMG